MNGYYFLMCRLLGADGVTVKASQGLSVCFFIHSPFSALIQSFPFYQVMALNNPSATSIPSPASLGVSWFTPSPTILPAFAMLRFSLERKPLH
jgi:hypothetical protein